MRLAVERRSRLEESRQLWQFYWDVAEEENWIKEMEQILSQGDIGHDLTTIHLLLSKHKSVEAEIKGHESTLQVKESLDWLPIRPIRERRNVRYIPKMDGGDNCCDQSLLLSASSSEIAIQ